MKLIFPSEIRHDEFGYRELVTLYSKTRHCLFEDIEIDMRKTVWFDADMCAVFGSILYSLNRNFNFIEIKNIRQEIERILSKNEFLTHYGLESTPDFGGTTITYKRFNLLDERSFSEYVSEQLIDRDEFPEMSSVFRKRFHSRIHEIFNNAKIHSHSNSGVFSCGQYYRDKNQLYFTVADLGVTIPSNVREFTNMSISASEAINWAVEKRNTTKIGDIPGGLGLSLLREFVNYKWRTINYCI